MYKASILADSISEFGVRLTTFEVKFPRIILAEFNTHRVFSRNFSSSRAIPVHKIIEDIKNDPFIPVYFGKNQKGMSAEIELSHNEILKIKNKWFEARDSAIEYVEYLVYECNLHKQIANRILEPWMWATGIVTASEYDNFFALRRDKNAQPEFKFLADMMYEEYVHSSPNHLKAGDWHIPMISPAEDSSWDLDVKLRVATGRLARVSYLTHDGVRDMNKDIELHNSLLGNKHLSPFEHCAQNMNDNRFYGNFQGWKQYRKNIIGESGTIKSVSISTPKKGKK
jgi:thymidylate synthase ThyX